MAKTPGLHSLQRISFLIEHSAVQANSIRLLDLNSISDLLFLCVKLFGVAFSASFYLVNSSQKERYLLE